MKAFFLACVLALAAVPAHADTVMAIVSSDATEWVGQGQQKTYTNANATFTVTGNRSRLQVRVAGTDGKTWDLFLKAPVGETFRPHQYLDAEREGYETGRAPSVDFSGDGRACNQVYADFSIRQIAFDSLGRVSALEASVLQRCESETAAPIAIVVMYRMPKLAFTLASTMNDWEVLGGRKWAMYNDTTIFELTGNASSINSVVDGMDNAYWRIGVGLSAGTFQKGIYLTHSDLPGGQAPAMMYLDTPVLPYRRSEFGKLEILTIAYANGEVTQLSARFWFYSDQARTVLLRSGTLNLWK